MTLYIPHGKVHLFLGAFSLFFLIAGSFIAWVERILHRLEQGKFSGASEVAFTWVALFWVGVGYYFFQIPSSWAGWGLLALVASLVTIKTSEGLWNHEREALLELEGMRSNRTQFKVEWPDPYPFSEKVYLLFMLLLSLGAGLIAWNAFSVRKLAPSSIRAIWLLLSMSGIVLSIWNLVLSPRLREGDWDLDALTLRFQKWEQKLLGWGLLSWVFYFVLDLLIQLISPSHLDYWNRRNFWLVFILVAYVMLFHSTLAPMDCNEVVQKGRGWGNRLAASLGRLGLGALVGWIWGLGVLQ